MAKTIKIECGFDGTNKVEGFGFVGTECNAAMKSFEAVLGKRTERVNKADMQNQHRVNCQEV